VIIVGQNIISASQDARAEADHETLTFLQALNVRQLEILKHEERILELMSGEGGAARAEGRGSSGA
jgi:hypothetical protein